MSAPTSTTTADSTVTAPSPTTPAWIAQARAEGLAPAELAPPARPWSVVLLTGLGAWLAVPPFLLVFFVIFGDAWERGPMAYLLGSGLTLIAVVVLRGPGRPLFLEQLAMPLLLTGLTSLGFAIVRDLPALAAEAVGLALAVLLIALLTPSWLRMLLAAAAAGIVALIADDALRHGALATWYRGSGVTLSLATALLVIGVAGLAVQRAAGRTGRTAGLAAVLEPVLTGGWLVVLGLFAAAAGWAFLAPGELRWEFSGPGAGPTHRSAAFNLAAGLSALWALAAAALLRWRWRPEAPWRLAPAVVVLTVLAALMPALGGCLLVLSLALSTGRRRLALAAAVATLWVISAFYYLWEQPLAYKALELILIGALLAAWARWVAPRRPRASEAGEIAAAAVPGQRRAVIVLMIGGLVALALVNLFIVQKERLIADGRPVFVPLAPVDPRSLMQGDYMRLSYDLPGVGWQRRSEIAPQLWGARPRVAVTLDARGIARSPELLRPDEAPPPGTQLLELTPKGGGWTFVSDAWFFREGEAKRWEKAKYGEFRVQPDGRGLLVGVVGEDLAPL